MPHYLQEELYKELRESTKLFDFIQESVLDGLWYWDVEHPEQEWMNPKFWKVLGYDPREKKHLSSEWQDIINADDLNLATQHITQHLQNPEIPYDQIIRYRHKDGHTVWIRCHGLAIRDGEGRPTRMIGVHNDVTQMYQALEDLKEKNIKLQKSQTKLSDSEAKFRGLFELSPVGIAMNDYETGEFLEFNAAINEPAGYTPEEFKQLSYYELTPKEYMEDEKRQLESMEKSGKYGPYEKRYIRKDGSSYPVLLHGFKTHTSDRRGVVWSIVQDITEIKRVTQELQNAKGLIEEKNHNMGKYIDLVNKYIITSSTDADGIIKEVSQAFCDISGYSKRELIGKNHSILRHPDMPIELYVDLWTTIKSGKTWHGEIKNRKKNGDIYWVDSVIEAKFDEEGRIVGYSSIRHDITDKKTIEVISITDGLTDIYNRRYFNETFPKLIASARRTNENLCFLMMDVDFFKPYNDNYGHQKGDEVLIKVAQCFKEYLRRGDDMVFRLGGEEFGILFGAKTQENALLYAEKLKSKIHALKIPHEYSGVSGYITLSMGLVCQKGSDIQDMDSIYKKADDFLYQAKVNGRDRVVGDDTQ